MPRLLVCRAGLVDYGTAWGLQNQLVAARRSDLIDDVLLLLEHPHTYTLGRQGQMANLLLSQRQLKRRGIGWYHVDRGGDITYHGPGQLVGYPILKLAGPGLDRVKYIRDLESALLAAVCDLGVDASLQSGYSGVWVGNDKVCAIGARIDARGVTSHGFALNVNTDLSHFRHIVPCGLHDRGVTSLDVLLKRHVSMRRIDGIVINRLAETLSLEARGISLSRLMGKAERAA